MATPPQFAETQRMRQPWLWALLGAVGVALLAAGSVVGLVVVASALALFAAVRLRTEVREDGVYVRFAPFHRSFRHVPFEDVERVEVVEFGVLTYGGIGIRVTPNAIAYVTRRGEGVKLVRSGQLDVVVGSRRADSLAAAIRDRR